MLLKQWVISTAASLILASNLVFAENLSPQQIQASQAFNQSISHQKEITTALNDVVADNIWQTLAHLTAYPNRSATKDTGVEAANWLKSTIEAMIVASGRSDTETYFVKTGWYKQPSLVTVIGKDLKTPAIVIGAHMDTLDGHMPGADEGSGAAIIMEAARVLLSSKNTFKRPVYIIWYAAGNRKYAGAQYVVEHFQQKGIAVKAVLQFDKNGYRSNPRDATMWVFSDSGNKDLGIYTAKLIDTYIHVPMDYASCSNECSDHSAWTEEGTAAAFATESNIENMSPYVGTSSDTMDLLSLEHMTNFSKLAVAFVMEQAL